MRPVVDMDVCRYDVCLLGRAPQGRADDVAVLAYYLCLFTADLSVIGPNYPFFSPIKGGYTNVGFSLIQQGSLCDS